jgi:deoxyribodipyrimidine photo-lyase
MERVEAYATTRNEPGKDATSRLSPYLKYGCIHPRTVLAAVSGSGPRSGLGAGPATYENELAWRDFYADVLWHHPGSARADLTESLASMPYARPTSGDAKAHFEAWKAGRTGYPVVDAGMRQLLAEGWMHNRVRMITASFLVKDLHIWWREGARWFLDQLVDGDLASNNHGWQWVAGTGTDPAPYVRVFNPVSQGERFDPDGTYVRRYVPELRVDRLQGKAVHRPWDSAGGLPDGYPERIVDHARERVESLTRYEAARRG